MVSGDKTIKTYGQRPLDLWLRTTDQQVKSSGDSQETMTVVYFYTCVEKFNGHLCGTDLLGQSRDINGDLVYHRDTRRHHFNELCTSEDLQPLKTPINTNMSSFVTPAHSTGTGVSPVSTCSSFHHSSSCFPPSQMSTCSSLPQPSQPVSTCSSQSEDIGLTRLDTLPLLGAPSHEVASPYEGQE